MTYDSNPKLKGRAWIQDRIFKQRKWIEDCEANGKSYTGENGRAIFAADMGELHRLEKELKEWDKRYVKN